MKLDPEVVKKDWLSGILPGIQVMPAGHLGDKSCTGKRMLLLFLQDSFKMISFLES
jgi:hypothetical protein